MVGGGAGRARTRGQRRNVRVHWKLRNCEYTIIKKGDLRHLFTCISIKIQISFCDVYDRCENLSGFSDG